MDLQINDQYFIVTGVTSGLGRAVAEKLISEGAKVLGVARRKEKLEEMADEYLEQFEYLIADVTIPGAIKKIKSQIINKKVAGVFINAGGPPAKSFDETDMKDWDDAYKKLLRWKVEVVKGLLSKFKEQSYGRILFLESSSVKQPIENLALSTALRMSVVGVAKTLSQEVAQNGITVNVLAPGSHDTSALKRLMNKKSENENISLGQAKSLFEKNTKVGFLGDANDLGTLAAYLLSPHSKFITGQTISVAGGAIEGVFG